MIREDDGFDITKRKEQELQSGGTYPVVTGSIVDQQKAQEQTIGATSHGATSKISKKYTDLIFKASGKYGNWDPDHTIEVGDWGEVDRDTGKFIRQGNLFRDPECSTLLSDVADARLVKTGSPEDVLRITAGAKMKLNNDLYPEVGAMGLGVRVSSSWEFTPQNRAAVLTATNAYSNYLKVEAVFPKLRNLRKLGGKAIVTKAVHCPAYALLLTEKGKGGKASLSLHTGTWDVGAGAGAKWKFTTESGFWRTACGYRTNLDGKDAVYTPLYKLEKIHRGWWPRYRGAAPTMEELMRDDYNPPWDDLDENGDEIPPEDSPISPDF
ncbi:unnamed protein product [Rhizoctonia solani]|uniref:Uncharacterized protein n=1 Tax=Rhizoctonia solani TaxID=456999 RepID=A0A8H2XNP8_9AGAM|nr:unnamed protein product [Rhizoctonia solani]